MNEYKEMMRINGDIIQIEPMGVVPYKKYRVSYNIRTIISPLPEYRDTTVCILTIPKNYPNDAPHLVVDDESMPPPWHVNWYKKGMWDFGCWSPTDSLVIFLLRCARSLQFDPYITCTTCTSNFEALSFWNANASNRDIIPSDTQVLPKLHIPEITTNNSRIVPRIVIKPQQNFVNSTLCEELIDKY